MRIAALASFAFIVFSADSLAQRSGQSMSVQTGTVTSARSVQLQSEAGKGAAVGGIAGYAMTSSSKSSSRRARNTILGAATGAAVAGAAQGSRDGMQYTVETGPGQSITVITDQTQVRVGDCVNVEQAGNGATNVRRVSSHLCEAAATNTVGAEIQEELEEDATLCLQAKERMMEADTDEALEVAIRRVHILCDD